MSQQVVLADQFLVVQSFWFPSLDKQSIEDGQTEEPVK